jgi:hypothetical protein
MRNLISNLSDKENIPIYLYYYVNKNYTELLDIFEKVIDKNNSEEFNKNKIRELLITLYLINN